MVGEDGDVVTYIIAYNTPNLLDSARIRMHIKLPLSDIYSGRWQIIRRIGGKCVVIKYSFRRCLEVIYSSLETFWIEASFSDEDLEE